MKKIISFFLTLLMVVTCSTVYATAEAPDATLDGDNIKISGKLNKAGIKEVTIQVMKPGREISELFGADAVPFGDVIAYQGQTTSDSDGGYEFEFVIKGDAGKY